MKAFSILLLTFSMLGLWGCDSSKEVSQKSLNYSEAPTNQSHAIYRFAIHPLHNPQKLLNSYQPLVDYLNRHLTMGQIELEASRDYQVFEQKFGQASPDLLLPNPWQTLVAMKKGYHVVAMAGDSQDFKGIFITRINSSIQQPQDLKGKTVSYPSHTALAACIMPQYWLYQQGVNPVDDIRNSYVGSQESSIMNAFLGQSAVAVTWPPPWRAFQKDHPLEADQLQVLWETPSLLNNSIMLRNDLPDAFKEEVTKALLGLSATPEGKLLLANIETKDFYAANNDHYQVVAEFIDAFEQKVRPVGIAK